MILNKIKYIYSDLDETIVQKITKNKISYCGYTYNDLTEISEVTKKIIRECAYNQIGFGIATGRSYQKTHPIIFDNKIKMPVICCDGTQIIYKNQIKLSLALPKSLVYIFNKFINRNLDLEFFLISNFKTFISDNPGKMTYEEELYADNDIFKMNDFFEVKKLDSDSIWNLDNNRINTILISNKNITNGAIREICQLEKEYSVKIVKYKNCIQILPMKASKATALQFISENLILDMLPKNTVTIGDGPNDLEMLKWSKNSVAVDNADLASKEIAKYICSSIHNDGVGHWIKKEVLDIK